jgi:DNA-binding CsgD family transcriptional regulator
VYSDDPDILRADADEAAGRGGDARRPGNDPPTGSAGLTPREREVITLLAEGLNGTEIAARLVLSPETVRIHIRHARDKLGARTRAHAVVLALRKGEISLDRG